jgi:hypothetical protein
MFHLGANPASRRMTDVGDLGLGAPGAASGSVVVGAERLGAVVDHLARVGVDHAFLVPVGPVIDEAL